jgi:hypothetical protein
VFSQIDTQIFSWWQFLIGRVGKTFIWINTKRLKIEIKNQVATIPNGRVFFGSYYPPRPLRHYQHSQPQGKIYQPMTSGVLGVLPKGWWPSSLVAPPIARFKIPGQAPMSEFLPPPAERELVEIPNQNIIESFISQMAAHSPPIFFKVVVFHLRIFENFCEPDGSQTF